MANTFETAEAGKIAAVAAALVGSDLNVANTFYKNVANDFFPGVGSTVSIRVPGAPAVGTKDAGDVTTTLTIGTLQENLIPVTLSTNAYSDIALSVADLSLNIENFASQVLVPQAEAVAKYVERTAVAALQAADADTTITYAEATPQAAFSAARTKLRANGVPAGATMYAAVAPDVYGALLDNNTTTQPLFDAQGRVRGFNVIESNRLAAGELAFYVPEAFALVVRAPAIPDGAPFGASIVEPQTGFALSYIRAFNPSIGADISLVQALVGASALPLAHDDENGTVTLNPGAGVVHVVSGS
ncbi:hypothetical protein GCM10022288_26490 [Gryllotalpicola kribbensis]|uniref:Baseplate protein J-like domain-containing protein n=1 Tax=Gryllotalpicola kribbensis TaxID=993084 RepID=A0ABP8AXX8_9MICO